MRWRPRPWATALLGAVLVTGCSAADRPAPPPLSDRVTTAQGALLGVADGGVLRYRGIPYAAPPVGELRWQPPQPAPRWSGVRPAWAPGPRCPQLGAAPDTPHATAASDSEDCLTLDVTVPAGTTPGSRLPVLVWVHGGGFSAGSGGDVDPRRLAEAGPLVVVTINYRLGILGFLGLPGLPGSGTFGLQDQQAALDWVHRNVTDLGGDPDDVTLGGESAGADSVCSQIASPGAVGLFTKAILQSGGCGTAAIVDVIRPGTGPAGDTWKPLPLVEAAGADAAATLGCTDPATALACMRAQPAARLATSTGTYWSPATGTPTLPRRPSDLVAARDLRPMPILAGTTRDEGALFTAVFFDRAGAPLTDSSFRALLASTTSRAMEAGRAYRLTGRSPGRAWSDVVTDRAYACPALATYRALGVRAPLFAYEFADPTAPSPFVALPADLAGGATHGAEMAYLFDLVPGRPALTAAQQALAADMVGSWARFVTTGDPNAPDRAPAWPQWSGDGQILTITGAGSVPRPAPEFAAAHHCALWGG